MKSILFPLSIACALLLGINTAAKADFNDGLVLYLPFDTAPVSDTALDQSGNALNATVYGAIFVPNGGKMGGAYQFDGIDDYLMIPQNPLLDVGAGEGLTLSAWYNTSTNSEINNQSPLLEWSPGFGEPVDNTGVHMWVNTYGFQWHPPQNPNGGGTGANLVAAGVPFPDNEWNYVISTTDRPLNEWHHLAVTYDKATGSAKVYVDGLLEQERVFSITPDTTQDLYLGIRPADYIRLLGLLDEVRVYDHALTAGEIQSMFAALNSGRIYQDFEPANGSDQYGWGFNDVIVALSSEQAHSGSQSWKITAPSLWGGTGIQSQTQQWHFDAASERHDRFTFWIWADPQNNESNNMAVKFFDHTNYTNGFEIWTTKNAQIRNWTKLEILLTQLPSDFNLKDIDKIEMVNYWPGTYYIDDIHFTTGERIYQSFEADRNYRATSEPMPWNCTASDLSSTGNCGWAWFGSVALDDTLAFDGSQSWKLSLDNFWGGTGVRSQEKRLCINGNCQDISNPDPEQSFWHVDLNPAHLKSIGYTQLTLKIYGQGDNEMDNNFGVQFFDWQAYHADPIPDGFYDKQVVWTRKGGVNEQWTTLSVPLDRLPDDFNLTDINKLQFQFYWPGTYHLDTIQATKPSPVFDHSILSNGIASWSRSLDAGRYTLQESLAGPDGPWQTIYSGSANHFALTHLSESWLRARFESVSNETQSETYVSDWSDTVRYIPKPVLIDQAMLQNGQIVVEQIPQASLYEIQIADAISGPWFQLYSGEPPSMILASKRKWYRARAYQQDNDGVMTGSTSWGPALTYNRQRFLTANGTNFIAGDGTSNVITLKGVNLGNAFIIEPWMFYGLNNPAVKTPNVPGYDPDVAVLDDWQFRDILTQRFGIETTKDLIKQFQDTYLTQIDLDNILNMGINAVRLPVYYRDIRELDDQFNWVGNRFNFDHIDRIIKLCADRGIYVLLDLHGAPGSQSAQDNSGRRDFNQLFNGNEMITCDNVTVRSADCYQKRTIELWQALATHYRKNTAIAGYDLLNEPAGADSPETLWQFYDQMYDAIRTIDSNHLIVMEGLWVDTNKWPSVLNDWDWLPNPSMFNWTNVAYQFHYYCWDCATGEPPVPANEQITRQKAFISGKVLDISVTQPDYNIPLMIGEFTGFGVRKVWEDYLDNFNLNNISWFSWAYKTHDSPSEWGLYTHLIYDSDLPDIRLDSLEEIQHKFALFDTANHHTQNVSLAGIIQEFATRQQNRPPVLEPIGAKTTTERQWLRFRLRATDADGDSLTYSAINLPSGAFLNSSTGNFRWRPNSNQSGIYSVTFMASDGQLTDEETISVTVINKNGRR